MFCYLHFSVTSEPTLWRCECDMVAVVTPHCHCFLLPISRVTWSVFVQKRLCGDRRVLVKRNHYLVGGGVENSISSYKKALVRRCYLLLNYCCLMCAAVNVQGEKGDDARWSDGGRRMLMVQQVQWVTRVWWQQRSSNANTTRSRRAAEHVPRERRPHVLQPACVVTSLSTYDT